MLTELIRVLGSQKLGKNAKQGIYKDGFYLAAGIFIGIGLNDIFRLSKSDINYKPVVVAGQNSPFIEEMHMDELYQYAIVAGSTIVSIVTNTHVAEVIPAAAGALTGIAWSNQMERKGAAPISIIPF